jgi:hypothetical protein
MFGKQPVRIVAVVLLLFVCGSIATFGAKPVTLVSVKIAPSTASIPKGAAQRFAATGTYSDGTTKDITKSVTWSSSNSSIDPGPSRVDVPFCSVSTVPSFAISSSSSGCPGGGCDTAPD